MDPEHPQASIRDESRAEASTATQHTDASRVSKSNLTSLLSKAQEHQLKMAVEKVKSSLDKFSSATRGGSSTRKARKEVLKFELVALGRFIDDEAEKEKNEEKNPIALKYRYWHVKLEP